jgi:hypothetical protein
MTGDAAIAETGALRDLTIVGEGLWAETIRIEEKETDQADDTMTTARKEEDTTVAQGVQDEDTTKNEACEKTIHHHHHRRNAEDAHTRNQSHPHPVALVAHYLHNKISSAKETTLLQQNPS